MSVPLQSRVASRIGEIWRGGAVCRFEKLPGGHSGITCLAEIAVPDRGTERVVIKATPPGRAPVGRHDVLRQARILTALTAAGGVNVPEVLLAEGGDEPYFVMRWHAGDSIEPVLDGVPDGTAEVIESRAFGAVAALAALHRIRPGVLGLHGEPVLTPRQEFERWTATMHTVEPELRAGSEPLEAVLLATAPDPVAPSVVHGDFRLGNTLCTGGVVGAVIDWEIWSVGDPRADLGWLLLFCDAANFPGVSVPGCPMPSAQRMRAAYEQSTGAAVERLDWFAAMARYKMAAVMGNNLARHRAGRHHDPFQEGLRPTIRTMIEAALLSLS
jgi:aminoglycoside phosphotransferase (APT) family kinase protein